MRRLAAMLFLVCSTVAAQPFQVLDPSIVGFRYSGPLSGGVPVLTPGQNLWISVDATEHTPRDLRIRTVHCDRDWIPTASEFVNDPFLLTSKKPLPSSPPAASVSAYGRTYSTSIPTGAGLEPFRHSGNYRAVIIDDENQKELVSFRFCVAERTLPGSLRLGRRRLPMRTAPWDEAHLVSVEVGDDVLSWAEGQPVLQLVRRIDIYKNREWASPYRIDLDELTPSTWVDGLGTSSITFFAGAVMPGNEYRSLDIRNADVYPARTLLRARDGSDVSRFLARNQPSDQNGASEIVSAREYADYESFEFQLWWEAGDPSLPVYVLGDFNGWTAEDRWKLGVERESGRFSLTALLKRGRYDYEYFQADDPVVLEGNSWDTVNLYTGLVYYSDPRLGGYDRILFVSQTSGNGTDSAKKGR